MTEPLTKKCENECPNPECNGTMDDIVWGPQDWECGNPTQQGVCKKCSCKFTEVHTYSHTEYELPKEVNAEQANQ